MKKEKARPLRWRLLVPIMVMFGLLWLGVVAMLFSGSQREAESQVNIAQQRARDEQERDWQVYEDNRARGLEEAGSILRAWMSSKSMGLNSMDGGMAMLARDEDTGEVFRSQLAWGYGHEEGIDRGQRWYLTFDQGLDREGQLALGRWITEHANGGGYLIYPEGERYHTKETANGTYARVTGLQEPGYTLAVQRIELVHPDGTTELMVETSTQGEKPITVELKHMEVTSVLVPGITYHGDGTRTIRYTDMERRLDNYLEAQAILDREMAGEERSVLQSGGSVTGMYGPDNLPLHVVAVQYQTTPYVLRTNWGTYLTLLVITALAALILSAKLSKKVTQPTEELCRQTEEGRCREDGPVQELNTLAAAFNAAQDKLEEQVDRERDFTRSAAHELKTPLAVLRAHAESLREDIDPQKREEYLDVVLEESDRMAALVGSLLELSRLEAGLPLNLEVLELSALAEGAFDRLALPLEQKHIALAQTLEETWLEGDREKLREILDNLASNALRHCKPGGTIRVDLKQEKGTACLTVENEGDAIPAEDLPRLWEPFYRGDKSRNRDSGGTGLGLTIVRAAVLAHGGSCGAENGANGPIFRVKLPLE